jgi:hypothetical protein
MRGFDRSRVWRALGKTFLKLAPANKASSRPGLAETWGILNDSNRPGLQNQQEFAGIRESG